VSWSFSGLKPGDYEVLAEVSGLANAKAVVELGAAAPIVNVDVSGIKKDKPAGEDEVEKLTASLKATGSYHTFETQNLGTLEIDEKGGKTLTIRPDATDWKPFNLRKITLKPVAGN
jgi:hypothetical protein